MEFPIDVLITFHALYLFLFLALTLKYSVLPIQVHACHKYTVGCTHKGGMMIAMIFIYDEVLSSNKQLDQGKRATFNG